MMALTLSKSSDVAQLLIALFAIIGVITSLYFSSKALRELQADRQQRQKPHLAFERGGYRYPIKFVKAGKRIPGVDPKAVERLFPGLPEDAESVRLLRRENEDGSIAFTRIGRLRNYGLGPALGTHVTWTPKQVWFGNEKFEFDKTKLSEPVYCSQLNDMPSCPEHILSGEIAVLTRLPTFIEKDTDKKITRVDGVLIIEAMDVFDRNNRFEQGFKLFTHYAGAKPSVHITFWDLIPTRHK